MKVKDLMTKKVITVYKNDSVQDCANKMKENDLGLLVVINSNREILGVITDRDIVTRLIAKDNSYKKTVDEVMTHTCVTINKDEDISVAASKMGDYQLKRLPVINDEKKLVGIITLSDMAICKYTNPTVNEIYYEIALPNPQKEKPLKYLKVDDFPL